MFTSLPAPPHRASLARHCAAAALLGALACAGLNASAAPLRRPRPAPPPLAPLATSASAPAIEHACATDLDGLAAALDAAASRAGLTSSAILPTPHSTDAGEIAVLEDDGTFFFVDKGDNVNLDVAAAARAFYRTHGDDYDQLAFWLTSGLTHWLGSPSAFAAAWPTRNDVSGIGLALYEFNTSLGVPARLQTILTMNGLHLYPADPAAEVPGLPNYVTQDILAHEFGHQWLAYSLVQNPGGETTALLGRSFQHWSFFFDADGSVMEGADWEPAGPDTFYSRPPITRFGVLDQYLMGVRAAAEVDSFFVLPDTNAFVPPGPYLPLSNPDSTLTARGAAWRFGIEDVAAANGPRVPAAALASNAMRVAFILVVPRGSEPDPADLAKLEVIRGMFPATVAQYTSGRMTLDATLDSRAGRLRLDHARLADTETPGEPRTVGVRVQVDQAGIPMGVDPAGVSVRWRTNPGAPWTEVAMTPAGADSFTALLPGQPPGTRLEYWFRALSDSAGLFTDLPELSLSAPFAFDTGPDLTPPSVTHWPLHEQSDARLPHALLARVSDGLGVDSVWCEYSVDGGPEQSTPGVLAGADSFVVTIGAGVARGSAIAYRLVARDASSAGNLGYSNNLFDTLRVGRDHVDGFWNPSPWTHANVRFNRRDEWHRVELAAAPAGSGAWHCGLDSLPYGPYQDAALISGLVYGITPGCSLTFTHRYDLEDAGAGQAYDGARLEVQPFGGAFVPVTPQSGYSHVMVASDQGLPQGDACWSGRQAAWQPVRVDLSPFAPGPIRVRFRMSSDLYVGGGGWWVDDVRVRFLDQSTTDAGTDVASRVELGPLWPNPSAGPLRQALRLPRRALVDWALFDVAGRRVATLWHGPLSAGTHELAGEPSRSLAGGLYFSRATVDGAAAPVRRVALVR